MMILHEWQGWDALGVAFLTVCITLVIVLGFLRKENNYQGVDDDHH